MYVCTYIIIIILCPSKGVTFAKTIIDNHCNYVFT